jgi:uncharacterized RDD family membrane protein YckC
MMTAEEEIEVPESNWGRRAGAYVIDMLIIFILAYSIMVLFVANPLIFIPYSAGAILMFLLFWVFVGVLSILYFGGLEGGLGATVGKGIMGLEVFSLDTETMTMEKGFKRSISKFVWFFVPLDIAAGSGKGDPRQRALDISANTIVADFIPAERPIHEPRSGEIYVKPIEPREEDDEFADFPIPKELLSGNCSRCSTPYNIVPSKDKTTWSGLWNSRCIWCNKKVFEEYKRRIEPGKWI